MVVVVVVAHIEMSMYVETPMVMRDTSERHDLFGDARHDLEPWECGIASVLGAAFPRPGRRATEKVIHTGTRAAQLPSSTASFGGGCAELTSSRERAMQPVAKSPITSHGIVRHLIESRGWVLPQQIVSRSLQIVVVVVVAVVVLAL